MQRITLESGVSRKLFDAAEQAVVCDERGRVIGLFSPMLDRPQIEELQLEPTLSIEETEKLRKNRNGKPLEEILHRLGY